MENKMTDLQYFKNLFDPCDYIELEYTGGYRQLELINKLVINFDENERFEKIMTYKLINDVQNYDEYKGIQDIYRHDLDDI